MKRFYHHKIKWNKQKKYQILAQPLNISNTILMVSNMMIVLDTIILNILIAINQIHKIY